MDGRKEMGGKRARRGTGKEKTRGDERNKESFLVNPRIYNLYCQVSNFRLRFIFINDDEDMLHVF